MDIYLKEKNLYGSGIYLHSSLPDFVYDDSPVPEKIF